MRDERFGVSTQKVPKDVLQARVHNVQQAMIFGGIDAILVTTEDNFRYFTGFASPTWVNIARPRYCIVPAKADLILIVPTTNLSAVRATTWVDDVRTWVSPNPEDDGVSLVADALSSCLSDRLCVGAEMGPQSRIGMPVADFLRLQEKLSPARVVDGDGLVREARKIKSAYELEAIGTAAKATSRAFARLHSALTLGCTDADAARMLRIMLLQEGIDQVPYLVAESGFGGYPSLQMSGGEHHAQEGTVLGIDAGCCRFGYYCDFNRNFAFGRIAERFHRINELLWDATEAGICAAVPGATASDIWHAQAAVIDTRSGDLGARRTQSGRMGHGIGLRLTEPPSIHPRDATVLAPGMVITIEPSVEFEVGTDSGDVRRTLTHEENIAVTEDGPTLLSDRAPRHFFAIE